MSCNAILLWAILVTMFALDCLPSRMNPCIYFKNTFPCKSLVTMTTFIWFLLSMIFCMYLKMTSRKIFVTMAALKWPSPMCVVVWYFKYQFPKKKFSKQLHWYGFSPVWILICFFLSQDKFCVCLENELKHVFSGLSLQLYLHWYVVSAEWTLECILKTLLLAKALSQWLHLYGFSPVWFFACILRCHLEKSLSQ